MVEGCYDIHMLTTRRLRTKRIADTLIVVGAISLLLSGLIYIRRPKPGPPAGVQSVAVDQAPSSVKPSAHEIAKYSVPATLPKYIVIPAIDLHKTRVIQLDLLSNGEIATPNNSFDTGWYDRSSKPGQPGAMFIFGHVAGWKVPGIFSNLKDLKSGDEISITRSDDQVYTYQVQSLKIYPYNKVDMRSVLSPVDSSKPGLNLMTCTGQIIAGTNTFDERLVVFTSLIKS